MAQRRAFSTHVVGTDRFSDMPFSAQALYFHICLNAGDKGISNDAKAVARGLGCKQSDLETLIANGYIKRISSWQFEIVHWYENNGFGETAKKRNNYSYRMWRKSVVERDGKCVLCGSKENLVAHHIKPFALFPEERTEIDNCVTLCDPCHKKLHKEMRECQTLSGSK